MTLGIYEYDAFDDSPYPNMARVVFVLFQILIPILLLNMLIAMMGNTYGIVIESAEKEFLKAWAKVDILFVFPLRDNFDIASNFDGLAQSAK